MSKVLSILFCACLLESMIACRQAEAPRSADGRPDITTAVKAAAAKDCGCGQCAAKGCNPCHGKNCYYCVAKALDKKDCGCGQCSGKGCSSCGPGCDVCKFHLAPVEEEEARTKDRK